MKRILVVDDEVSVVDMLQQALRMMGFSVETALDGEEGIKKFQSGHFDVVIVDLSMPKLNGNQVCEEIRKSPRSNIAVIGISGTPWDFSEFCFDAVMQKPLPFKKLVDQINQLIQKKK